MSDAEIVVPWFWGENELRKRNRIAVEKHLLPIYPYHVITDTSVSTPGGSRNYGVGNVEAPVVVFNDADTVCPPGQIREAVRLAGERPGLVFAYDLYVRLAEGVQPPEGDDFPHSIDRIIENSGSMGCVAISRACFEEVGGFDESYSGWGYEDLDFAQRCQALWPNRRVSGPVYHLWHGDRRADDSPLDSDETQVRANFLRWCEPAA
jgi:N-terminal domain of galactosyltransferase